VVNHANLVAMHRASSRRFGPRAALRYKQDGLYHDISWHDYRSQADDAAAGLVSLGIRPGDRVGIFSENRYEWLVADIAVLTAGAADVPLHAPLMSPQAAFQLRHSGCRGLIVGHGGQIAKVAAVIDQLPDLEWVVSFDIDHSDRIPSMLTWAGLIHRGREQSTKLKAELDSREQSLTCDDLATIIYTSGTTGQPKGVMLTHGNLLSNAEGTAIAASSSSEDILLSWLPYSHIYARTCDHYVTNWTGATVCLAESMETLLLNLAEIRPTDFTSVPRFYEKVWTAVQSLPAVDRGERLRRIFGPRIRRLSSGGAPLPLHVAKGFAEAGLPLLEGYGLTESSPVISFNRRDSFKLGTVGKSLDGVQIRIAEDGEILTKGPHVMKGYWNDPESTCRVLSDGWLQTGDVGHLDDEGFLTITDRKKDLIITSGGKNIAPSELERLLVSDPYIEQAVIHGDQRPFVSALLVPNFPLLQEKANELGCNLEIRGDFIRSNVLMDFLKKRVDSLMLDVSKPERVKVILILARPLQVETDEITATHKVRRKHLMKKFESEFDAIYASAEAMRLGSDD
jgi:long-chain acyl-CoA synthetase